jgi:Xaa-Pro aminopeptidase
MTVYEERRAAFARQLGDAIAIVPAAIHHLRNNDTEYEFRQNSDFYYLTGFLEPEAVLVVTPGRDDRDTLFLRKRDRTMEIWNGKRLGVESAAGTLGVHAAFAIDELPEKLPDMLHGYERLAYNFGWDERFDRTVHAALGAAKAKVRRGGKAPRHYFEPGVIVHEMRLIKSEAEIETLRRAAQITRLGHLAGMRATRPGMWEYELEALIEFTYRTHGAQDMAYPSIVAGGDNATILHYNTNREQLRDGALVLVDSGAELDMYASDVTRTWPVGGRFSAEQRAIYEIVLAAQKASIADVRPGVAFRQYQDTSVRVITEGLLELGLLQGTVAENIESQKYRDYFMHNTGHWLGLDVHCVGQYRDAADDSRKLEAGMVLTVEPGIYIHHDLEVPERWKGIGVRIEDDILCAASGPVNLSDGIPKEIPELEEIVGSGVRELAGAR